MPTKDPRANVPTQSLLDGLSAFLSTKEFSDLEIVTADGILDVHKVIVCSQSKVLKAMCTAGFKESTTNTISLTNDPPHLIGRMVQFLYNCNYSPLSPDDDSHSSSLTARRLLLHVDLYALADKYDITSLAELAKAHYADQLEHHWDALGALETIPHIYASTPESNRGLRDIVVREIKIHAKTILGVPAIKARFDEIFSAAGQFAGDMVTKALAGGYCRQCGGDVEPRLCASCAYAGHGDDRGGWNDWGSGGNDDAWGAGRGWNAD